MRRALLVVVAPPIMLALAACGGGAASTPECGWDLSTAAGRQANADRLTFANDWLTGHPGQPVPAPTSTFWHGECPSPSQVPGPPLEEGDQPGDS